MSYLIVDTILKPWADGHDLHIHNIYQDVEVRSLNIVSPKGKHFQLWIDEPTKSGEIGIHVWDMKKQRKDYFATKVTLKDELESAYQEVVSWF